jgi:hypothetical protein
MPVRTVQGHIATVRCNLKGGVSNGRCTDHYRKLVTRKQLIKLIMPEVIIAVNGRYSP